MAGKERNGKRKTRNEFRKRVPDLGYYYIVTDTQETDKNYLEVLKRCLPEHLNDRLVIKVTRQRQITSSPNALQIFPWLHNTGSRG